MMSPRQLTGISVSFSIFVFISIFSPLVIAVDTDGDGWDDAVEYTVGSRANDPFSNPGMAAHSFKLRASDGAASDGFSQSAIDGDTLVVGAFNNDEYGLDSGAAYVFTYTGGVWVEQQKLTAGDAQVYDEFGTVAISGDTIAVGALREDENGMNSGSVYIFTRTAGVWSQQQKLIASDGAADDFFGTSLAITNDTLVIGASGDDDDGSRSGSAYVFTRTAGVWSQQQKLTAVDASEGDYFGSVVAISNETVVIGAYQDNVSGPYSGSAYVFTRSGGTWSQQQKLTASDGGNYQYFGSGVAVENDTVAIGARRATGNSAYTGAVYIFTRSGAVWTEQQKLIANDGYGQDYFGDTVAMDGDLLVVSAHLEDEYEMTNSGAAYVFTRSGGTWSQQQKLTAADAEAGDLFGSVSISGKRFVVGAPRDDDNGTDSGSVYVFDFSDTDGDGLTDDWEALWGFDPNVVNNTSVDTDGDGLDLLQEQQYRSNPTLLDTDGDTWSDGDEALLYGTDPANADTDGDGVNDNVDVLPLDPAEGLDTDGDGIGDNTDKDDDNDSIPDTVENSVGLNPLNASDALLDLDGDGWSNEDEYRFATVINDFYSNPQTVEPHIKLRANANDGAADDNFGSSSAIDGNTIVIGSPYNDIPFTEPNGSVDSGAAYVFVRTAGVWAQQQKITASDANAGDRFGTSVALSGNTLVVGSILDDDQGVNAGAAYVYTRTAGVWSLQQKLTASDGDTSDAFGASVAIEGDTLIVGAESDDNLEANSGSAYVFVRSAGSWSQQAKLVQADAVFNDTFGSSVDISGDSVIVGAWIKGAAYVFTRTGTSWSQQQKLTGADGSGGQFGQSVSIDGDSAIVGAPKRFNGFGMSDGAAYVFTRSANVWSQQQKLTVSDTSEDSEFGYSVGIAGDVAVIGAYKDDDQASQSGSAYVLTRNGSNWTQYRKINAVDGAYNDYFGYSVGISGRVVVVGAYLDDDNGSGSGSAYTFDFTDTDGDTLTDVWEGFWGFDPSVADNPLADTDSDGQPHLEEQYYHTNPGSSDTDGDGVSDPIEIDIKGTDPNRPDTDGDGVSDLIDVWPLDPSESYDTDNDGIGNNADLDDDGDLIPDTIETGLGLNPLDASDILLDLDGDGWSNGDEYRFATGIDDPESNPQTEGNHIKLRANPTDAGEFDNFGFSVAIDGDTAVIGAYGDTDENYEYYYDSDARNAGSVYVFVRSGNNWIQQQKLRHPEIHGGSYFGYSVDISADTIVVGAWGQVDGVYDPDYHPSSGAAYIFTRSANVWSFQKKLVSTDLALGDNFGFSVTIDGNTAVIGARYDTATTRSGSAYVFTGAGSSWTQQAKLVPSDGASSDQFGRSVALDGDTVVIGASYDDDNGYNAGSAYVFTRNSGIWTEQQKLLPSDGSSYDQFGNSVAIDDDTVVIGAYLYDDGFDSLGAAYVFIRNAGVWSEQQILTRSDAEDNDQFGISVAIDGDRVVVSAWDDDDKGLSSGSSYLFTRSGSNWTEQQKFTAADGQADAHLGSGAAIATDTVIVGAYYDDDNGINRSGSAYVFDVTDTDGDGLTDLWEDRWGYDKNLADNVSLDADGDGLNLLEEQRYNTNPSELDTDGDGLSDGDELNTHGTNPNSIDTNGNGLPDGFEVLYGPLNPDQDTDADGRNNLEESLDGGNPLVNDTGDANGDGLLTIQDLLMLQQHILSVISLDSAQLSRCDVNRDGQLDASDLLALQASLSGN